MTRERKARVTTTPIATPRVVKRVFNFNAGPATLPLSVLERIREELLDYRGTGMSVMEMTHRSPEFEEILFRAERNLCQLLAIPQEYAVLFLQGGGSLQFTMAASTEAQKFARVPRKDEITLSQDTSYVYMASNNTIEGTQWSEFPDAGNVPLVADMSSDIASRPIDVSRFGLIFAGAQKNLGPAGVTVVIVRRDLAERADNKLPTLLQYRTEIKERSLFHTPPTFAVYIVGLVLEWLAAEGGVAAAEKRNEEKARLLYDAIDASGLYSCPVSKESRSRMNVVFRVAGGGEKSQKKNEERGAAAARAGGAA